MKVEACVFGILTVFVLVVTPIYWLMSEDPTGTTALVMTFFLCLLIGVLPERHRSPGGRAARGPQGRRDRRRRR